MFPLTTALSRQPEWRSLRYSRLLLLKESPVLQGLVRDTIKPSWSARLLAGLHACSGLAIPVVAYGLLCHDWELPLTLASAASAAIMAASLLWVRAARECNKMGLWNTVLGIIDIIRLRRLVLDAPCAVLLVRYRKNFVNLSDARETMLRIAGACAKREGVFLDYAVTTTKQVNFLAGDLANRLVALSDDKPEDERDLRVDLVAVTMQTEWLHPEVAFALIGPGFRTPI